MASNSNTEVWRPIPGCAHYEVSNLGRVRSLARWVPCKNDKRRFLPERIIKTPLSPNTGYPHVVIERKTRNVHRLVALAFLGDPPFPGAQVNHINNDRSDARLANLEWVTPKQNQAHSWRTTVRPLPGKDKFSGENGAALPVVATCLKTGRETHYEAAMDAVRAGFRSDGISRSCNGKIAHHAGHRWRFADGHVGRPRTP